jgi:hypothetical protein
MMKKTLILLSVLAVAVYAADEVKITTRAKVDNGFLKMDRNLLNDGVDQSTARNDFGSKKLKTATNSLPIITVTSPSYFWARNLATNGGARCRIDVIIELRPGEACVFPAAATNILAFTTNSTAVLDYLLLSR